LQLDPRYRKAQTGLEVVRALEARTPATSVAADAFVEEADPFATESDPFDPGEADLCDEDELCGEIDDLGDLDFGDF
jgi:hypothetical protein